MSAEWIFDSAFPSVNFLNTLRDRYLGGHEMLATPEDLGDWLVRAGIAERPPRVTAPHLDLARELRETMDAVLMAVGRRQPPPAKAVRALNKAATAAPRAVLQLRMRPGELPGTHKVLPGDPVAAALATLAADAIERVAERALVRECAAEDCSLRFVDLSPAHNKQWCSMTRCGNRAKSRNHYRRAVHRPARP